MTRIRPWLRAAFLAAGLAAAGPAQAAFEFVALGDMPYGDPEAVYPKFEALIGAINAARPAFTIHVGDIKSGGAPCTDEEFGNQRRFMNTFDHPVVYTPGDNEWTDCHRASAGAFDPLERLATLRRMFFEQPRSLGARPMALERQADAMPGFATYVENSRFTREGVMFVLVHIVGSNNNFETRDPRAAAEFFARNAANIAWLEDAFAHAMADGNGISAMVVAFHGDPFQSAGARRTFPAHSGFTESVGRTLLPLADRFAKPVLVIHGDSHVFRIDRPFRKNRGGPYETVTRLEVFGDKHMHAVLVRVDPATRGVFSFAPIYNPMD